MSLDAKLAINASPSCKIMKFVGTDKVITMEEALSAVANNHHDKFTIKTVNIPVFSKEQQLMFYKVGDRKANATNTKCAAFLMTIENTHFRDGNL